MHILFKKNAILCLFLKNISPSKRVLCFILNNLHFLMMEGIAFYATEQPETKRNDFVLEFLLWCFLFYQKKSAFYFKKNAHFI